MALDATPVKTSNTMPGATAEARTRQRGGFRGLVLVALGLFVALIAQVYMQRHQYPLDGAVFYVIAVLLFYRGVRDLADAVPMLRHTAYSYQWKRVLPALAIGALALVLFARENMPGSGTFESVPGHGYATLLVWLAAMLALVIAYWRQGLVAAGAIRLERGQAIALSGILLLAFVLRVYRLDAMPGNIYLDEGDHGLLALRLLNYPGYVHYVPDLTGHATLFFYGLGAWIKLVGLNLTAMRLFPVLIGMLAVAATYFLSRELLGPRGALVAAFIMAISRWHITFSRYIFTAGMVTLFMALVLWLLVRALRTRQPLDFIWAGIAFALGLSAYLPIRFVLPGVVGLYLVFRLIADRSLLRVHAHGLLLFAVAFLIGVMPLAVYFQKNPEMLLARAQQASVQQDIQRAGSLQPLKDNVRKAFGMFNYEGDPRARHNLPLTPMVDPVTGVFFILGAGYALLRARKAENSMLISWLVLGVVPGVMSLADSNPHSMRTIANIPAVSILAALSVERCWTYVRAKYGEAGEHLLLPIAVLLAVVALGVNVAMYFNRQAGDRSVYYDYDPVQTQVAREVVRLSKTSKVYVAAAYTNHSAVKLLARDTGYQTFNQTQHLPVRDSGGQDLAFILEPVHRQLLALFQKYYPAAQIGEWKDTYGNPGFLYVTVKEDQVLAAQGVTLSFYRGVDLSSMPAVERSAQTISADWSTAAPLDPPFTAVWRGALYVARYGSHSLILESSAPASVTLDSQVVLDMPGGRQSVELSLFGGFHTLAVHSTVTTRAGNLSLLWRTPESGEQVIARNSLYAVDVATNGLVGKYYRGNAWQGAPAIQQKDLFIFPNDLLPAPFSIEWEGKIYAPQDGQYVFGTQSDDGSQLFIDGKLVVDNGGHHADRYVEGRVTLAQGLHDLRLRYFQDDGGRVMELYWAPPGGRKEIVPNAALFPPNTTLAGPITLPTQVAAPAPVAPSVSVPGSLTPAARPPVISSIGEMGPVLVIGREGNGPAEFRNPRGVAVDQQGNIYVADTGNKRVQKLNSQGQFLAEWKGGAEPFVEPVGIAIAPNGDIFVLEPERDGAHRFTANREYKGKVGDGLGLYRPRGLTIGATGVLYFANTGGNNIVRTSIDGRPTGNIGVAGTKNGELQQPTDVISDAAGNVYVADAYNRRIQRFTADGRYATQWAIPASGTSAGPHLAIGASGVIFVSDPDSHLINAYSTEGAILATWGGQGAAEGQLLQPVGLFMDSQGLLYIADSGNHRIQVWGKR